MLVFARIRGRSVCLTRAARIPASRVPVEFLGGNKSAKFVPTREQQGEDRYRHGDDTNMQSFPERVLQRCYSFRQHDLNTLERSG